MAKKPRDPVQFTYESAERIANVVRAAETLPAVGSPLRFGARVVSLGASSSRIRTATFTGAWGIGAVKNVTYKYVNGTANAYNDLINLPSAGTRTCVVGREGTAWRLMNWQWDVAYAATAATLSSTALRFDTVPVAAVGTSSVVTFSISATACTT